MLENESAPLSKGHVLFISRQRIVGRTNGSSVYLLDLALAVRRAGFSPHLVQPSPDIMGRWPIMRLTTDMGVFESHAIRGVLRIGRWVVSRDPYVYCDALIGLASRFGRKLGLTGAWLEDRPRPYSIAAQWCEADHDYVAQHRPVADVVIADYAFQAEALRHFDGKPSAIVMHDLFHSRRTQAGQRDSVVSIDPDSEAALLSRASAVVAIQSDEAQFVVENVPDTRAILAPFAMSPVACAQAGTPDRLLFVGSNTAPNIIGLTWFFEHVWPQLRIQAPAVKLDVVGSVSAAFSKRVPAGVRFHGLVKDLSPFYAKAGIVVSPLTFGSGLKIKLVEALAHGKAIVATSITLQGIEKQCCGSVIKADDPEPFIHAVLSLMDDQYRARLAHAALQTAIDYFSPQACHAEFSNWLKESERGSSDTGKPEL